MLKERPDRAARPSRCLNPFLCTSSPHTSLLGKGMKISRKIPPFLRNCQLTVLEPLTLVSSIIGTFSNLSSGMLVIKGYEVWAIIQHRASLQRLPILKRQPALSSLPPCHQPPGSLSWGSHPGMPHLIGKEKSPFMLSFTSLVFIPRFSFPGGGVRCCVSPAAPPWCWLALLYLLPHKYFALEGLCVPFAFVLRKLLTCPALGFCRWRVGGSTRFNQVL